MSQFLQWISCPQQVKGKTIFFLTDRELYSARGQRITSRYADDPLGYGAIRAYYGLPAGEGEEMISALVWSETSLPEFIAEKLANFDIHWGVAFRNGIFSNGILRDWILHGPDEWKVRGWRQLQQQNVDYLDLFPLVICAEGRWQEEAARYLLSHDPINYDLMIVGMYARAKERVVAVDELKRRYQKNPELCITPGEADALLQTNEICAEVQKLPN